MRRSFRRNTTDRNTPSRPTEAWLFAQALLGNPIPTSCGDEAEAKRDRERLEWLAGISTRHEEELRRVQAAEAQARHDREMLEWLAGISTEHEEKLRIVLAEEAAAREARDSVQRFAESLLEDSWDPGKHPRGAFPQNRGWWSPTHGSVGHGDTRAGAGVSLNAALVMNVFGAADASESSRWYLPSDDKGSWAGAKGDSTFRLKSPVEVNGKLVHEIEYSQNLPILDKHILPGKTATIILTGDHATDLRNAKTAWTKLNPGKPFPSGATFHHDLRQVTEQIITVDGKKTKVLVGRMQLVPRRINELVFHQGSASVANRLYRALGVDIGAVKTLAEKEASMLAKESKVVANAAKKIVPGTIPRGIRSLVGRTVVRILPLVGTGLAMLEFSDNVEAHGIGGALVRATPVLGDLIGIHDLGRDLAQRIVDDANAKLDATARKVNLPVTESWRKASDQMLEAYQDLASQIPVKVEYGIAQLVDPDEVATALRIYRGRMQQANLLKAIGAKGFDFDTAAADAKQELKRRLIKAAQRDKREFDGPLL